MLVCFYIQLQHHSMSYVFQFVSTLRHSTASSLTMSSGLSLGWSTLWSLLPLRLGALKTLMQTLDDHLASFGGRGLSYAKENPSEVVQ